jgi:hypothetical protein
MYLCMYLFIYVFMYAFVSLFIHSFRSEFSGMKLDSKTRKSIHYCESAERKHSTKSLSCDIPVVLDIIRRGRQCSQYTTSKVVES